MASSKKLPALCQPAVLELVRFVFLLSSEQPTFVVFFMHIERIAGPTALAVSFNLSVDTCVYIKFRDDVRRQKCGLRKF